VVIEVVIENRLQAASKQVLRLGLLTGDRLYVKGLAHVRRR